MVVLEQLPVALFRAFEQQADALLREYALRSMSGTPQPYDLDDVRRAGDAYCTVAGALNRHPGGEGTEHVDLPLALPADSAGDFSVLQGVLDDAVLLARRREMLTLPSLPEVIELRDWICDEVTYQSSGRPPQRWEPIVGTGQAVDAPLAEWDGIADLPQDTGWLVGDDHNRIIAASEAAATLLGWRREDLIGQRLLVVIPRGLRERHVAAFTRNVVSGQTSVLGLPLELPALTRQGTEVAVSLRLTRHAGRQGRTVYLAEMSARP